MKILFTTPVLEHPPAGGPQLRIENSIKALNRISELHVLSRVSRRNIGGMEGENYYKSLCFNFIYTPTALKEPNELIDKVRALRFDIKSKTINWIINLPFKIIDRVIQRIIMNQPHDTPIDDDARFIERYARQHEINIIWFGYGNISYQLMKKLKTILPDVKMVCDTDSVWSRFILRELDVEKDPERKKVIESDGFVKEQEEIRWVDFMDVTTAVSEVDAEYYRGIAAYKSKIHVFSNVIDVDTYKKQITPPGNFKKPCIYLAGSFGHDNSPMDRAAIWVLDEIYPLIKKSIPEINFYIIGRNSERLNDRIHDRSIHVIGRVDSVLPYLCNADVALVPLKFESGTRFKILEAGACGIPIVSTTLGAEGLPVKHGKEVLIADTNTEFADAIVKLVSDKMLSQNISNNCMNLIKNNYSIDSLIEEGKRILSYLELNA